MGCCKVCSRSQLCSCTTACPLYGSQMVAVLYGYLLRSHVSSIILVQLRQSKRSVTLLLNTKARSYVSNSILVYKEARNQHTRQLPMSTQQLHAPHRQDEQHCHKHSHTDL